MKRVLRHNGPHSARTVTPRKLFLRRFGRSKEGAAAVEFALIALPFFMLLMGIIEVAIIIFTALVMEHGVIESARQIRTGQFQATGGGENEFRTLVCSNMPALVKCDTDLHIDVQTFADFGSTNFSDPTAGASFGDAFGYQDANSNQVVLVRVYYLKKIHTPLIGLFFANYGTNQRIISWAAAFETEPF